MPGADGMAGLRGHLSRHQKGIIPTLSITLTLAHGCDMIYAAKGGIRMVRMENPGTDAGHGQMPPDVLPCADFDPQVRVLDR